ncbi:hypothetical protein PENSUB_7474 [Penicillium subrubescens]|uniref:Uncharacterized protein n=1 Tax=Penicillium subrubescens TaxID=1316194 RepID=A0A1Q5TKX2_9EURO|nr:hypothetical protein PENSUB_7474 [Penicillium subrubescens]
MFAMRSAPSNTEIAQICLVYLLEPSLYRELSEEEDLTEHPFARFAAKHWFHHYSNSNEGKSEIEPLVLRLFKDNPYSFAAWIGIHGIDQP